MPGRPSSTWEYGYADLIALTGKSEDAVYQAASRGVRGVASGFDPTDFRSVVLWIFRNSTDEFRWEIMKEMGFFRGDRAGR